VDGSRFGRFILWGSLVFLAACAQIPGQTPTEEPGATEMVSVESLLPSSLYYLSDLPDGVFQVWRLDENGALPQQVTDEAEGVTGFDVNRGDGRVVYISQNRLYLIDADGSKRRMLVDGGAVDELSDAYHYTQKLAGVAWSDNGRVLAYGLNGIHLYFLNEQSDFHVVQNVVEEGETGTLFPVGLYTPISWSPDSNALLVGIGFFEGGTLGVYNLGRNELVRLGGEGIVCCQPAWTPDSSSVLVASPMFGIAPSGLWRYDAQTGEETELIHHTSPDETLNFVNWPLQLPDGSLRFFFNNMAAFPTDEALLLMVTSGPDGIDGQELIRPEYWENYEVLWAEDGSLAVAVQPATGVAATWPRTGPIVVIPASSDPPVPLPANGYNLRWGP
jgi:WD40 repeat protein